MLKKELVSTNISLLRTSLLHWYRGKRSFGRLLSRFRYPGSLPEEVGRDFGIKIAPNATLLQIVNSLIISLPCSKKLHYNMSRESSEKAFKCAFKKEQFHFSTLFSYYFSEGWLVFTLHYDEQHKLRRLQVQCPLPLQEKGFDLLLPGKAIKNSTASAKKDSLHSSYSL